MELSKDDAVKLAVADVRVTMLMWAFGIALPITWAIMLTGFGLILSQVWSIAARLPH